MNTSERVLQRHKAYEFLSKIYLYGLMPSILEDVRNNPVLKGFIPSEYDEDTAKAVHQELFGFNIQPYASVFLTEEGQLGSQITTENQRVYFYTNFSNPSDFSADHIGVQLAYLSYLTVLELGAMRGKAPDSLEMIKKQQRMLIQTYVLPWLPAFVCSVDNFGNPFYGEVVDLTLDLICDHVTCLSGDQEFSLVMPEVEIPDLLGQKDTGIKEIATYLTRPVMSGIFISRDFVRRLGGALNLPSGFGDRAQMLNNAFQSAISYGELPAFVERLQQTVSAFEACYECKKREDVESLNTMLQYWIDRTTQTRNILNTLLQS